MNEQAANALYEAGRKGVKQGKGARYLRSDRELQCANDVLRAAGITDLLEVEARECDLCGEPLAPAYQSTEAGLVAHLNDDHDMTFSQIARKLGPDGV